MKKTNLFKSGILIVVISIIFNLNAFFVLSAGWYPGDSHMHTGFSTQTGYDGKLLTLGDNCMEEPVLHYWGYDVADIRERAEAMGLDDHNWWFSLTDHSYCIDSSEWQTLKKDAESNSSPSDQTSSFLFMPGEELSVREDCASGSAHLGAHGISTFISQSPPESTSPDSPGSQGAIDTINNDGAVSIINHPGAIFDITDDWESISCTSDETGIEIWNTCGDLCDLLAINFWKDRLLQGIKTYAVGGTDTHKDPKLAVYNYAYLDSFNTASLKKALKEGKVSVSNNGLLYLEAYNSNWKNWTLQGSTMPICSGDEVKIKATYNLGGSCDLRIIKGIIGQSSEDGSWVFNGLSGSGNKEAVSYPTLESYFRAECIGGINYGGF